MKCKFEQQLTDADHKSLFGWSERVFPAEGAKYSWVEPTNRIVTRDSGIAIAHLGFSRFNLEINSKSVSTIGVGGVVVRPEYQGKKIPYTMFSKLHSSDFLSPQSRFSSLFCPLRLAPYYAKHGYDIFNGRVRFLQNNGHVEAKEFVFMLRGIRELSGDIIIHSKPW